MPPEGGRHTQCTEAEESSDADPRCSWLLVVCLAATTLPVAHGQVASNAAQSVSLSQAIPVDPEITVGSLSNGLRYYVRANKKPEKRAELRLVVKAGSILEDDDQRGLAHFAEHMAFNGTRNFPKHEVVSFLESLGMRFGADINAYTSFDETVYTLTVPTDKPETMDRALLILEDWAQAITFDPVEIDKERGVVLEEWRVRRGAGARMQDKVFPIWLKGSRYPDRLPIGTPEVLKTFAPDRLKKFYTDWYRPDLMAVVAVGDFDKTATEGLIKTHFSRLKSPAAPRARPIYDIPDQPGTRYALMSDKEMTTTSVQISTLLPARPQGTVGVYRQEMVDRLFSAMLSARLSEITQKADAPFIQAFAGRSIFLARTKESTGLNALVKEDGTERGLDALLAEVERASRFGFTATELDRQKQTTLRNYERIVAEKETRESQSRASEYIRNFLENESLPTADYEFALHQRFLPEVTLAEVNKLPAEWFPDRNRIVIAFGPDKAGLVLPDEAKLAAIVKAAPGKDLKPYEDTAAAATLLDPIAATGTIARTSTKEAVGITEWDLSNGVKVVLKPTNFKEDEILFRATSPGGTSLASDKDYIPASTASQVDRRGRPRQVQRGRSAASAHRKNRRRHSLHRRARRGPERQQLAEGPGNAVSAHLHALYATEGGCDGLRGAADADESGACEPDGGPRVRVPGDALDNALPEPRQETDPVASQRRRVESRRLGGLLQGAVR